MDIWTYWHEHVKDMFLEWLGPDETEEQRKTRLNEEYEHIWETL